jgi:predicted membrane protein
MHFLCDLTFTILLAVAGLIYLSHKERREKALFNQQKEVLNQRLKDIQDNRQG